MTNILMLGASSPIIRRVESLPGHSVVTIDREKVEHEARPDSIESLLRQNSDYLPDVVFLGDAMPVGEALSVGQMIDNAGIDVELMLVAEPDTELALRAMRVGVREIVSLGIGDDELKVLLHRASANVSSRLSPHIAGTGVETVAKSRVIVVLSAKGGVGKSTIAANLAVGLSRRAPMETVLVDLDVQFGDAATLLDLNPTHSIADAFGTTAALDTLILKTFLTVHPAGFYVLAGADSPTVSDHVGSAHIRRLLSQLSSQFRYVVVDTGAGLSEHTLAALEEAHDVVIVSSMDVSSIRSVRKEVDVLNELSLLPQSTDARHVVLNMADRQSGLTEKDVEAVVGLPIAVSIPRSADVPLSGNRGEPLLLAKKPGPAAKALTKLVDRLADDEQPEEGKSSRKGRRSGRRTAKRGNQS